MGVFIGTLFMGILIGTLFMGILIGTLFMGILIGTLFYGCPYWHSLLALLIGTLYWHLLAFTFLASSGWPRQRLFASLLKVGAWFLRGLVCIGAYHLRCVGFEAN
jgi:hypothetical protein